MKKVKPMSFEEKSRWLRHTPVTAAKRFQYRLNTFSRCVKAKPLDEIVGYAISVEFQARESPHAHCALWVKILLCMLWVMMKTSEFNDQYLSRAIPAEGCKLKELVLLLQQHKHSSYCKRNNAGSIFLIPRQSLLSYVLILKHVIKRITCGVKYVKYIYIYIYIYKNINNCNASVMLAWQANMDFQFVLNAYACT